MSCSRPTWLLASSESTRAGPHPPPGDSDQALGAQETTSLARHRHRDAPIKDSTDLEF